MHASHPRCSRAPCPRGFRGRRRAPARCCSASGTPSERVSGPSFALSPEEAFSAHWAALARNDEPHCDAGVETLYAFADVDLYAPRSRYFGVNQDLGQFEVRRQTPPPRCGENTTQPTHPLVARLTRVWGTHLARAFVQRFRRVMHTPQYRVLLNHVALRVQSTLRVSERDVWQRVHVTGFRAGETACYCLTLRQQLGGRRDGWWMASSLSRDPPLPEDDDDAAAP